MRHLPALFVADAPALDFLNSVATPSDATIDWLADGEGLLNWLEQAGLVSAHALKQVRAQSRPGELDKVADQARNLREWFRAFVRKHKGGPLNADAVGELRPLNRLLERDESFRQIEASKTRGKRGLELRSMRRWRSSEALLLPIAETLAHFVCTDDFTYVKACEGPSCTLLFEDRTRTRARRWCSMAMCGNRAKQAAYRHRHKGSR